jgi:hypothetical protein
MERTLSQCHIEDEATRKENCKGKSTTSSQGILWEDVLLEVQLTMASYADALRQDKQHQQPQATQTEQHYLPQKEFQKTGLSVQAPSSSSIDTLDAVVHQIMTELSKAVSEDRVVVITKLVLNLMQQND